MYPRTRKHFCNLKLDIPLILNCNGEKNNDVPGSGSDLDLNYYTDINSKLVETAIKFFLFQRGQTPILFDNIQRRINHGSAIGSRNGIRLESGNENKNDIQVENEIGIDVSKDLTLTERIRLMKLKRQQIRGEKKQADKFKRIVEKEENILSIWDRTFESLRRLLAGMNPTTPKSSSEAVIFMLGPSIFNPKEVIVLEFMNYGIHTQSHVKPTTSDVITITRSFYKSLIMSSEFTEFTDKSLRSTYSHICVLTKEPMDSEIFQSENIALLENTDILTWIRNPEQNTTKQILHIRLNLKNQYSLISSYNSIFDASSTQYYFYRMPLRFKGISSL